MSESDVTVVVVPRERFSGTKKSLESIFTHTEMPYKLIYVDGKSPKKLRRYLEQQSRTHDFTLIRKEHYLTPNEARNIGLESVDTKYIVFVDNDLVVQKGWLEALVQCADDTNAWVVGPTYLVGKPEDGIIHLTSGRLSTKVDESGYQRLSQKHLNCGRKLKELSDSLQRSPSGFAEFHCMLLLTSGLRQIGGCDNALLCTSEHLDVCLRIRDAGGPIFHEPKAVVTYTTARHFLHWYDLRFFLWRWSESSTRSTLNHFREKYNMANYDKFIDNSYSWVSSHRRIPARVLFGLVRRLFRGPVRIQLTQSLDRLLKAITPKGKAVAP